MTTAHTPSSTQVVVVTPTQERASSRPGQVVRASSARGSRSGALPSTSETGHRDPSTLAGGRARVLHLA